MINSEHCPYKGVTKRLCHNCANRLPDIDGCALDYRASAIGNAVIAETNAVTATAHSWEEQVADYNHNKEELLKLTKEELVDLILARPQTH